MLDGKLSIGLIGAGRIGSMHAQHLAQYIPTSNLLMVADTSLDRARECAAKYQVPQAVQNHQAILANPDIQAVAICSATHTHAPLIEEAAQAGKHIFCEKPIALTLKQIDQALTAVQQHQVKLQVGFNRRFDANYRRVREAVKCREIGQPHLLHLISRDPSPPPLDYVQVSGGLFLDMMIHDFDMARFLIGDEVTEVYALGGVLIDEAIGNAGDIDTALVTLKFANGTMGTIDNSRQAVYGYDQRAEVLGSEGSICTDNGYPNTATLSRATGVQRDLPLRFFMERYRESYIAEMTAFVNAVLKDEEPPVNGQDGRLAVVLGLASAKSLAENRPVSVAEVDSLSS